MAKKKSNNLSLLLNVGVIVGLVVLVVGICLALWEQSALIFTGKVGIFGNKDGIDYAFMGTLCEVLLLVNLVLAALYVVVFCLDTFKIGKFNYAKLMKLLALIILVSTLLALVLGVLYAVLTSDVQFKDLKTYYVKPAIGFYFMIAGSLLAGVLGLLANHK